MSKLLGTSLPAVLTIALWTTPGVAGSCVDVDLGFDPASASPGDRVTLSASVENTGDEDGLVDLDLTVEFNDFSVGPILSKIPVAAGETLSAELPIVVPMAAPGGTLTLALEASAGDCTDAAMASLEIVPMTTSSRPGLNLESMGRALLQALDDSPTPVEETSWGKVKALYGQQ
jgi:hypothetical protein